MKWRLAALWMFCGLALGALQMMAKTMTAESLVFCSDLQARSANLLFEPTEILQVQRADQSMQYEEGRDFTLEGRTLKLTEDSRIPVLQHYSVTKDAVYRFRSPQGFIYSPGGTLKHCAYDIEVSYVYEQGDYADFFNECAATKPLSFFQRCADQRPVNVLFFGDSISVGAQASGANPTQVVPPGRDAYSKLVFKALEKQYPNTSMTYHNHSSGGKTMPWGLKNIGRALAVKPDLLVLAFGMNDATSARVSNQDYLASARKIVEQFRAVNPEVSILLVSEFSPNPELAAFAMPALRKENRDGLFALQRELENCAAVDVGSVSRQMVALKKFCDISANNVNHPNDFMYQVYADALLHAFEGCVSR